MSVAVVGANERSKQRPVAAAPASEKRNQPDTSHRCTLPHACEHLRERLMIQKVWKIAYSFFLFFFSLTTVPEQN